MNEIVYAAEMIERHLKATVGISWTSLKILQAIHAAGGSCTTGEVARRIETADSSLTAAIDIAERAGLVQRERSKLDRRVILLHPTDSGRTALTASHQLFNSLSPPEPVLAYLRRIAVATAVPAKAV